MLASKSVPVLKKLMDKKSKQNVSVSIDKKYLKISGNDFTYMIRLVDGEYFKTDPMLNIECNYKFKINKDELLEVMKYDSDLIKDTRKPVVFAMYENKLYLYCETYKYEAIDKIDAKEVVWSEDLAIKFSPSYFVDVMRIIDVDEPICYGGGSKQPLIIKGNEYKYLICPVFNSELTANEIVNRIRRKVA